MDKKQSRAKRIFRAVLFLLAAIALTSMLFDDYRREIGDPPAARLLPNLPSYRQVEGQTITTYIGTLSEGAALLAGQPHLAVTLGVLDQMTGCYQDVGAVRARVYSRIDQPMYSGLVAVVDDTMVNDPETLFRCITPAALNLDETGQPVIEPCAAGFTLDTGQGKFHIIYAASDYSVCVDLCSSLANCSVHTQGPIGDRSLPRLSQLL